MKKRQYRICMAVLLIIILLCGFMVGRDLLTKQKEKNEFLNLADMITLDDSKNKADLQEKEQKEKKRNLSALSAENSECIVWIYIPGTQINYPVMHTPKEPQKYLNRNFYGEYSYSGVPFLDGRCDLESDNLILYGHHMRNGTMFAGLCNFTESKFCKQHSLIEFESKAECGQYTVFAVMRTNTESEWYRFIETETEEEYNRFIEIAKKGSLYVTGITPVYGEQILTLSTCIGIAGNERLIVAAVKKK